MQACSASAALCWPWYCCIACTCSSVPWISSWASARGAGEVSLLQPHEGFLSPAWDESDCILLICSENQGGSQISWGDPQSRTAELSFRSMCPVFGPITCFGLFKVLCSYQPLEHREIVIALPPSSPSARSLMSSSGCSATTGAWHMQESLHKTSSTQLWKRRKARTVQRSRLSF